MQIFAALICLSLLMVADACQFWRRKRLPKPNFRRFPHSTHTIRSSTTKTAITSCTKSQKCLKFTQFSKNINITQASRCAPYLRNSCVSPENLDIFNDVTQVKMADLEDILMEIENRNCGCFNRSIEIFCRFLLPQCSIPELPIDQCAVSTCSLPIMTLPCSNYCKELISK